jgi:hypothetical protein
LAGDHFAAILVPFFAATDTASCSSRQNQRCGAGLWPCGLALHSGERRLARRSSVGLPTTSALAGRSVLALGRVSPPPWSQSLFGRVEKNHCSRRHQSCEIGLSLLMQAEHSLGRITPDGSFLLRVQARRCQSAEGDNSLMWTPSSFPTI